MTGGGRLAGRAAPVADAKLRQLERRAATGDPEAWRQALAHGRRQGLWRLVEWRPGLDRLEHIRTDRRLDLDLLHAIGLKLAEWDGPKKRRPIVWPMDGWRYVWAASHDRYSYVGEDLGAHARARAHMQALLVIDPAGDAVAVWRGAFEGSSKAWRPHDSFVTASQPSTLDMNPGCQGGGCGADLVFRSGLCEHQFRAMHAGLLASNGKPDTSLYWQGWPHRQEVSPPS